MRRFLSYLVVGAAYISLAGCDGSPSAPGETPIDLEVPTTCEPDLTTTLEVGQSVRLHGTDARFFCIEADGVRGDYVLALFSGTDESAGFTVRSERTIPTRVFAPTSEFPGPDIDDPGLPLAAREGLGPDDWDLADRHHMEWRDAVARELGELVGGGPVAEPPPEPRVPPRADVAAAVPFVGTLMSLNAQAAPGSSCDNPLYVTGRVEAVSQHAIVVADIANPSGGFTTGEYQHFAATFDTLVTPLARQNFGEATDIDGNGRTILFFTREVNRRSEPGGGPFVVGFFHARDLFPRGGSSSPRLGPCAHSNEAEILYLMVPDPEGQIHGQGQSKLQVERIMLAAIIHEKQHLINAARRLYVTRLDGRSEWAEEGWLNEALSHTAEELLFYRMSGLAPRSNIGGQALDMGGLRAHEAFDRFQRLNFLRFFGYIASPEDNSPFGNVGPSVGVATRGAAWSFLRYAADRRGGSPAAFYRALIDSPQRGIENLAERLGGTDMLWHWFADWGVAIFADGRVSGLAEEHRERSWNLPSIHRAMYGSSRAYPIAASTLRPEMSRSTELTGGGAAYFRFGVAPDDIAQLEITHGSSGWPPASLYATVLRTR